MYHRVAALLAPLALVSLAACFGKDDDDEEEEEDDETVYSGACPQVELGSRVGGVLATGSTRGADDDWGECGSAPASVDGDSGILYAGAPDVSLSWTAPSTGAFTVHTNGSRFDTLLTVLDGGCTGEVVDCDDDGGRDLESAVYFEAEEGRTYVFIIDGYDTREDGDWKLSVEEGAPDWWGDSASPAGPGPDGAAADPGSPTVRTGFGPTGVTLHVDGGPGGWWLGAARTGDPTDPHAFLADCHSGAFVGGTWHSACQPVEDGSIVLAYGGDPAALQHGTTLLRADDADRVTWMLESDVARGGDGRCFVWGHQPSAFAHLRCEEL